jgi:hypothetical protein
MLLRVLDQLDRRYRRIIYELDTIINPWQALGQTRPSLFRKSVRFSLQHGDMPYPRRRGCEIY